jgi:hypothetical protein
MIGEPILQDISSVSAIRYLPIQMAQFVLTLGVDLREQGENYVQL